MRTHLFIHMYLHKTNTSIPGAMGADWRAHEGMYVSMYTKVLTENAWVCLFYCIDSSTAQIHGDTPSPGRGRFSRRESTRSADAVKLSGQRNIHKSSTIPGISSLLYRLVSLETKPRHLRRHHSPTRRHLLFSFIPN